MEFDNIRIFDEEDAKIGGEPKSLHYPVPKEDVKPDMTPKFSLTQRLKGLGPRVGREAGEWTALPLSSSATEIGSQLLVSANNIPFSNLNLWSLIIGAAVYGIVEWTNDASQ